MIDAKIVKSTVTSTDNGNGYYTNPVIFADVPDMDLIRTGNVYYMASTTMHLSPGCPIAPPIKHFRKLSCITSERRIKKGGDFCGIILQIYEVRANVFLKLIGRARRNYLTNRAF